MPLAAQSLHGVTAGGEQPVRRLIVNADDFGMSERVNRGILAGHRTGIVTSASLLVRWPRARDAVGSMSRLDSLGLGLHIDLGEWAYKNGTWTCLYQVVPTDDARAVAREVERQLGEFERLTG